MDNALELKSNLVMPAHCVELDREEMCYVEGGEYISYGNLKNISSIWMANFIVWTADAVTYGIIAGCNWWNPVGWAAAAIAATSTAMASVSFSNYSNSQNALALADYYQMKGYAYTIYRSVSGLMESFIVERV